MKVGIIGAGYVGSTTAFSLIMSSVAHKVILVDINKDKAMAEATDIVHAAPFANAGQVISGDYKDLGDCEVVIITAGANQKPGETRIDLLQKNIEIFAQIIPQIVQYAQNSILLIATNPVDIMTQVCSKLSGFARNRVIGSGTVLDTARFRSLLGSYLQLGVKSIHADVIGEHGDSEVLVWSNAEVGTLSLEEYAFLIDKPLDSTKKSEISNAVVNSAYKIIAAKSATYYGIAGALTHICRTIANNEHAILTVASCHEEVLGVKDVCLSLPSVVYKKGIHNVIIPKISEQENLLLKASAEKMADLSHQAFDLLF